MGIIDPIAMTNAMAAGGMDFGGGVVLGLTVLGLLAGCAGGILLSRIRPARSTMRRRPRLASVSRSAPLPGAAK